MIKPFLRVLSIDEARELLTCFGALGEEEIALDESLFRVLAKPVTATEDLPGFNRSTMDGFAVRSTDTFGATESSPALLRIIGEARMGDISREKLRRGNTVRIWTGGALPPNADAVVMVEHTQELDAETVEILKAVAPFEHVVRKGEDFKAREVLLAPGRRLRPQDLGLIAAMGMPRVTVRRRPSVAVISSGDEIVPVEQTPPPGCMRDVNRHTLQALIVECHATPVWMGIAPDNEKHISRLLEDGLNQTDVVLISGGSSMGSRDLVIEVLEKRFAANILLHGVSVSPGKPLIVAQVGSKPVFGLPGHPISAMVSFQQFVEPLLRRLEGEDTSAPFLRTIVVARLARNIPSQEGRTDFVRVRLKKKDGELLAMPVPGKSGMISGMVRSDGFVTIQADSEGLYKGDRVAVHLFSTWIEESIEKEYLPGHEGAEGGAGDLFKPSGQERLSRI